VACVLAKKLGRPVKNTYDRDEVFYQNKGRHPCKMHMKMGVDEQGKITGVDFTDVLDGGAHTSWGFIVMWFSAALTHLPYKIPNVRFRGRRVYTNKPKPGAQRCLGGVQVRLCVEFLLDQAADELGLSPYDLRLINAVETGYEAKAAHRSTVLCCQWLFSPRRHPHRRGRQDRAGETVQVRVPSASGPREPEANFRRRIQVSH